MATGQLWLFPPPRPLVERLGEDFFRQLPTGPGVYLFCGPAEGVLYVGKARNLRRRLSSYRVANPERLPRRIIRLLHRVTRIEWDLCRDEGAARAREELLICVLAPPFNRAGKVWMRPGFRGLAGVAQLAGRGGRGWAWPACGPLAIRDTCSPAPPAHRPPHPFGNAPQLPS